MTKRLIYCIFMLCLATLVAQAQQAASITDRAAQAAHDEMYNDALKLYREAEHTQGASSALYYNMANTYYHLKDNPRALLYYDAPRHKSTTRATRTTYSLKSTTSWVGHRATPGPRWH